jgi:chromosome condensin MukBEF complex kleisin-like MukF subunit
VSAPVIALVNVDGEWRIPAWQLAGFLASYVASALDGDDNMVIREADAIAEVALELAYEELLDICNRALAHVDNAHGVEVADRVMNADSTEGLAVALAAHALATGGWA